jgi:hypothetical protein
VKTKHAVSLPEDTRKFTNVERCTPTKYTFPVLHASLACCRCSVAVFGYSPKRKMLQINLQILIRFLCNIPVLYDFLIIGEVFEVYV